MNENEEKDILYYSFKKFFKNLFNGYKKNYSILKNFDNRELLFKFVVYKIVNNDYFINNYYLYDLNNLQKKEIFNKIKNNFIINSGNISLTSNKLNISNLFVLKKFVKSSYLLIRNIFFLLINIFYFKKIKNEFIIIYSKFAKQDKFDKLKIKKFFSKKSIELFEKKNIIFMNRKCKNFDRYYFSKEPILYLATNYLDTSAKLILISRIIKVYIKYFFSILSFKPIVLLADDLVEAEIVTILSEKKVANKYFIMNASTLGNLKFWMDNSNKKIETHCYWESASSFYQIKTADGNSKINILNAFMNFTNYYLWNPKCEKFIRRFFKNKNISIIEPMDLYFTNKKNTLPKKDFNIGIFDTENLPNILVGNQLCKSFKNNKNLRSFYMDIFEAVREIEIEYGLNIQILVKRKLDYKNESKKFILNIDNFNLIDHDIDLPNLFKDLDTVICMPYTSVSFIFTELEKKPSFFYDGTSIIKEYKLPNNIYLVNNKKQLKNRLLNTYKSLKND